MYFLFLFLLNSCVGSSTSGIFGSGVSIALDPRTLGTQIDDSIMQKNLSARLALKEKTYLEIYLNALNEHKPEKFINIIKSRMQELLHRRMYILSK